MKNGWLIFAEESLCWGCHFNIISMNDLNTINFHIKFSITELLFCFDFCICFFKKDHVNLLKQLDLHLSIRWKSSWRQFGALECTGLSRPGHVGQQCMCVSLRLQTGLRLHFFSAMRQLHWSNLHILGRPHSLQSVDRFKSKHKNYEI